MTDINLFFVAHQDDELLTFGGPIISSLASGCETHVICCSQGERSSVRLVLGNGRTCPWHDDEHSYTLNERAFTLARDSEFFDSCLALGVPRHAIGLLHKRFSDGMLSPWDAAEVMASYLDEYPGATIYTHTPLGGADQHRDHQALGIAALMLQLAGKADVRYFIDPYFVDGLAADDDAAPVVALDAAELEGAVDCLHAAAASYRLWDPASKRYAIGYHSVPDFYAALEKSQVYYRHDVTTDVLPAALRQWHEKRSAADRSAAVAPKDARIRELEGECAQLQERVVALEQSRSYKLGHAISAPYRALRGNRS